MCSIIIVHGAGLEGFSSAKTCKPCSIRDVANWMSLAGFEQSTRKS
jgi:hypothetical protein